MDYFAIFLLTVIILTFLSDKKVLSIKEISGSIQNIETIVNDIYNDIIILNIDSNSNKNIGELLNDEFRKSGISDKKYVVFKNTNICLTDDWAKVIIANFVKEKEKASAFMPSYEYQYINNKNIKEVYKELNVVGYNYLNIFSKSGIKNFGVLIIKTGQLKEISAEDIVRFSPNDNLKLKLDNEEANKILKNISNIYSSDVKVIIKSLLLVFVGTIVTANLITAIYAANINNIIVSGVVYWCYSFVLNYMYKPIGKYKIISKYLLPIFLLIYLFLQIINAIRKYMFRNKKVHAS